MPEHFDELYRELLMDVVLEKAREHTEQGEDALSCANMYAEQGKPDFVLAYLLLANVSDEEKCDIFARSYERRAIISEAKADSFDKQFHRPFPLIKLEAERDRIAAQHVRLGKRVQKRGKTFNIS